MRTLVRGTSLFIEEIGAGPPLLLVHGPMGFDHTYFRPWLDGLETRNRLIFLDLRGHGRSDPLVESETLEAEEWAEDIEAVREQRGLGRIVILGHSLGGLVALLYARRFSTSCTGLVLSSALPVFDYAQEVFATLARLATPEQLEAATHLFAEGPADDEDLRRTFIRLLPLYIPSLPVEALPAVLQKTVFRSAAFKRSRQIQDSFDTRPWLPSINAPVLVIEGSDDFVVPPALSGAVFERLMPRVIRVVLPKCGHFPFVEAPEAFRGTVAAFLDSIGHA